jgi:hypothetical protein
MNEADIKIQELITYVTKRKKPWAVAVFDRKTKKRAVGNSLGEILKDFGEHSDDLVVVDYQEWKNRQKIETPENTL